MATHRARKVGRVLPSCQSARGREDFAKRASDARCAGEGPDIGGESALFAPRSLFACAQTGSNRGLNRAVSATRTSLMTARTTSLPFESVTRDRHADVLRAGPFGLVEPRGGDDVGFGLREVFDGHAARNPAHADGNGDLGAHAGGEFAEIAHGERVHGADVIFDGAALSSSTRGRAWAADRETAA